jgi:DNA-binding helix-hairpin-helix protein with protein kinase domain
MEQNGTFEQNTASRKVTRLFLGLQLGAMVMVLSLIALQLNTLAFGIALFMLLLSGTLLLRLYERYQASLHTVKRDLQVRAIHLQEQLAEEQQRLTETNQRRGQLVREEEWGLEATLFNLQQHHIVKGLSKHRVRDAGILGLEPDLIERLTAAGIHTALDVSAEAVSQVPGFGAAKRVVQLVSWRSTLFVQLVVTKPRKLPAHQLEYIQKKFQRLHAANDEKEKKAAHYHQRLQAAWNANELRLKQLASVSFWDYLADTLASGEQKRVDR